VTHAADRSATLPGPAARTGATPRSGLTIDAGATLRSGLTTDAGATLRSGLTTGTCAAAAAKAAALALAGAEKVPFVEITLPGGALVEVPVESVASLDDGVGFAVVVKDAGDDPDVTNGSRVEVALVLGGDGVRFSAGQGVGTVTRDGLQLAPGEPAINPVPREMIAAALAEVLGENPGALVTVGIPGGEELAAKTFNPRLGIEGGLSVIGTSGRVEPKSTEAWMRSLLPQVDVVLAAGHRTVWLTPGGLGEQFAIQRLGAPAEAIVQCSNFVGELLDYCGRAGVERVVLVGHAGKLVKVAAGIFDTHSRAGDARLETVAALAAAEGAPGPLVVRLLELPTVQAAIAVLADAGLAHVWDAIARRAAARATQRAGVPVGVVLIGYEQELLGASEGALAAACDERIFTRAAGAATPGAAPALAVVGVGPGAEDLLSPAAWREIRRAEAIAGGARLLNAFAPDGARRIPIGGDVASALAQVREALDAGLRTVVLASGDPGFFGVLPAVRRELPDAALTVVPGVSSAQLAMARLGESWEGAAFASAHGRDPREALEACERNERTLVLADREATPQALAGALATRGDFHVTVCERLGYSDERITAGSASEIADGVFDPLALILVKRLEGPQ
jgi:cobalt-precorrin-5B (C1)-methyltransferase